MTEPLKILHLEDLSADAALVARALTKGKIDATIKLVDNKPEFKKALRDFEPDIILCDHTLAAFNSIEALKIIKASSLTIPFILVTGTVSENFAVEIMKQGAFDYILKDNLQRLPMAVRNAMGKKKAETGRQLFLQYLKHSEERYRHIVETSQEGIWLIDEKGLTIFANKKMCEMLGYQESEMMGKESTFFMREEAKLPGLITMNGRNAIAETIEMNLVTKYGKSIWVNITVNPIFDDHHYCKGTLGKVADITIKKLHDEKHLKEKVTEQKNITKEVINASEKDSVKIGTELHENISQLLAASKLFLSNGSSKSVKASCILQSQQCITMAMEEISKLYHVLVGPDDYYMLGLVSSIEKLANDVSERKNIKIKFDFPGYSQSGQKDDAGLNFAIYRIIHEQLNNVAQHSGASECTVELTNKTGLLIIAIKDNGKGFDTGEELTGIGLKNIRNRAEMYDGSVNIISSPGNGCEITICFKVNTA